MKIKKSNTKSFNQILPIIESYYCDQQLVYVKAQLKKEFDEIDDNRIIFIAEIDEESVAMIQLVMKNADNDLELANGNEICHVHNLQVRKDLQSLGIGRKMMDYIEKHASQLGKKFITLGVDGDNERAIRLYKSRNYKIFKTEEGRTQEEILYLLKKAL